MKDVTILLTLVTESHILKTVFKTKVRLYSSRRNIKRPAEAGLFTERSEDLSGFGSFFSTLVDDDVFEAKAHVGQNRQRIFDEFLFFALTLGLQSFQ